MPKLGYTAAQIRAAEAPLLAKGVPLMIRAAQALADHVTSVLPEPSASRVLVLAGAGDNGGDACWAASFLAEAGVQVNVVPVMGRLSPEPEAGARESGARILTEAKPVDAAQLVADADVIIDGMLGIGAGGTAAGGSPALRGTARDWALAVHAALTENPHPLVIAVDLPSGIDPDSGEVAEPEAVIPADLTVTFIGIKAGCLQGEGAKLAGKVWLEPIGASQHLLGVPPAVTVS
ncbi:NAD(P)H-hydrate epimerase [Gulosibacter bifidus]|uniref:NAD(P)H-hydrate epimerase n=1 Tax=Gulosibacter bifidus TaxID=272239 RepID=A0ABW5RIJ6_9MICO|nr:NAD(P)H-hydrate epimerase [Gulosibacter bifidus]